MSRQAKPARHGDKWRIRPYNENGERFSEVYNRFEDAVFALERHRVQTEEILRGLRAPLPPSKTFHELCDDYLKYYSSEKRNVANDTTIINTHLRPFFGKLKLHQVGLHVAEYKYEKQHLAKKTLHHQLTLLITMLRVAHFEKKWLKELPRIKKPKLKLYDKDFSYIKTDEDIRIFLQAALAQPSAVAHPLYATAIYTGMRAGELAGLSWDSINFERRQIKVHKSYDGPTKSDEARFVPILDVLLPILQEWRLRCVGRYVFPNEQGTMLGRSARLFQEVFHRVLDDCDFPKFEKNGRLRRYIVFHDLRHTFASQWMMKGGDIFRLSKILGHADVQMTQRYSHLALHIYAEDYGRFGSASKSISSTKNVLTLVQSKLSL